MKNKLRIPFKFLVKIIFSVQLLFCFCAQLLVCFFWSGVCFRACTLIMLAASRTVLPKLYFIFDLFSASAGFFVITCEWRVFIIISRASKWGTPQKHRKLEMRTSCRNSLDLHWSAWPQPGRGSASVPRLRYLSVSRHFMNRRHSFVFQFFRNRPGQSWFNHRYFEKSHAGAEWDSKTNKIVSKKLLASQTKSCTNSSFWLSKLNIWSHTEGNLNRSVTILTALAFSSEQFHETAFWRCWKIARLSISMSSRCVASFSSSRRCPLENGQKKSKA